MAVGVANRTLAQVVRETARLCGFIINEGTATAGTTTSLTDANNERTPIAQDASVVGTYIYITGGLAGAVGNAREISSYATLGVFTWIQAVGTAPDSTSTWIRVRVRPQRIIDAIDEVTRRAWRKQAIPWVLESITTNNLLGPYGTFEAWENGASSAPDGWTLGGSGASVARESTTIAQGLYSAALTAGSSAVGTLSRTLSFYSTRELDGISLTLLGAMAENAASDGVVRVTTTNSAGTATNTDRTGTYASNRWQDLDDISSASISTPDPVVSVQVQCRAVASATVYFDDLVLYGPPLYNYPLDPTITGIGATIWMESAYRSGKFTYPLYYDSDWDISTQDVLVSSPRQLHLKRALPSARHLRMEVYRAPDVQATATSNVEPNPVWLAHAAAVRLLEQEKMTPENVARLGYIRGELERLEKTTEGNTIVGKPVVWIERR